MRFSASAIGTIMIKLSKLCELRRSANLTAEL
jgi:hypothetical protein